MPSCYGYSGDNRPLWEQVKDMENEVKFLREKNGELLKTIKALQADKEKLLSTIKLKKQ
jgi:hypothetical protein